MIIPVLSARSVLILVDLQQWIVDKPLEPIPGPAVVEASVRLREAFDAEAAPVVIARYVRADGSDGGVAAPANRIVDALEPGRGEHVVTRSGVDAFSGTRLVSDLRDLGAKVLVIAGIATEHGVAATAGTALQLGYEVLVVSDATTGTTAEEHAAALRRLADAGAKVVTVGELLDR
ncbi:isochorismate hydrolase [Umezawaea tangerina]|uniref:Isochorismate hydrolase n=1 Tax=Umezawaea tangerina TaxID=84725 RepID=A0A2T0TDY0_9PSEU|nr:isochorismate hydrolase [Umezawaea tangerina]